MNEYLTVKELHGLLQEKWTGGLHIQTIYRWIKKGLIPHKKVSNRVLIPSNTVDSLVDLLSESGK